MVKLSPYVGIWPELLAQTNGQSATETSPRDKLPTAPAGTTAAPVSLVDGYHALQKKIGHNMGASPLELQFPDLPALPISTQDALEQAKHDETDTHQYQRHLDNGTHAGTMPQRMLAEIAESAYQETQRLYTAA